ncbi:MAG: imidazole glycerol phosphate synthase subunit HisH [Gammaproteobacteria bacterium]|nr:imidazole glycerol phosphate synthase subunit HisH [Gammaproteobacteria bacterium]
MIRIIDYGLGNVSAFLTLYKRLGIQAAAAKSASMLDDATHLILPGVGAFDHAVELLDASGMRPTLESLVKEKKLPILGICVGMQILATSSEEGTKPGLDWIPGQVRSFRNTPGSSHLPMPHMGWNDVTPSPNSALFAGSDSLPRFYFLHSYYFDCDNAAHIAATADYGAPFVCAVSVDNIHGVQCHPEKSHRYGLGLLKAFSEI